MMAETVTIKIKFITVALFNTASGVAHDLLKQALIDPLLEPTMDRALAAKLRRQIFPLGPVVENPEDALDSLVFVCRRSPPPAAETRQTDRGVSGQTGGQIF